jgi:predicted acyltransferase
MSSNATVINEPLKETKPERMMALDVFRGVTIAGMVLVNNPGSWGNQYGPVAHAKWNGCTPTDLIFPFFLFIVGVAMTFSFDKRLRQGCDRLGLFLHVCQRTIVLFLLGLILNGFPFSEIRDWGRWRIVLPYIIFVIGVEMLFLKEPIFESGKTQGEKTIKIASWILIAAGILYFFLDFRNFQTFLYNKDRGLTLRVPGVLQRIALCYFFASIIMFFARIRGRILWALGLMIVYWAIVKLIHAPAGYSVEVTGPEGLLHDWIDWKIVGSHVYSERPDPEGLLSTLPAIATTLLGILCGNWLHQSMDKKDKCLGLFFLGNILLVLGMWTDSYFAINKKIWTSPYVLYTAGLGMIFLGMCYYLVDIKGYKKWAYPFMVYGTNAIFLYVASGILGRLLYMIKFHNAAGETINLKTLIYNNLFTSWMSPKNASLFWAIAYVFVWFLIIAPLYRRKIFIKV